MINGWPYAAKAIIQHEFDTDHLNVWLTFSLPMRLSSNPLATPEVYDYKPTDDKWIVTVDGVVKAVVSSAWQDFFTMLLTVGGVSTPPTACFG